MAGSLLPVSAAQAAVLQAAAPLPAIELPLAEALGRVLAEDAASDVDSPPHDKSMVDGYAVRIADLAGGEAILEVLEEVTAGEVPSLALGQGQTARVMTGAPVSEGTEAVVMVERSELLAAEAGQPQRVRLREAAVRPGQNIMRRAEVLGRGDVVLPRGTPIGPAQVGLLAEVGRSRVSVVRKPRVAVLSTGNELVPADEQPGPGQIRNSNGPMLVALIREAGAEPLDLGIIRDEPGALRQAVASGLAGADLLVLSGGVSAGVLDLVPGILAELGVEQVFHKVDIKPGKPLWFGVRQAVANQIPLPPGGEGRVSEGGDQQQTLAPALSQREREKQAGEPSEREREQPDRQLVFGLPGNPVSSFVCFQVFVRPAIHALSGHSSCLPTLQIAPLACEHKHASDRPTYCPGRLLLRDGQLFIEPVRWRGSADLRGLALATALALFPAGERVFAAGETVEVYPF